MASIYVEKFKVSCSSLQHNMNFSFILLELVHIENYS